MELYQIKTFLAVVEESSVTKAAKRLYTTPPSVSSHIKALEEELGVRLFDRSTKGMSLTTDGIAIRDKARSLLDAALEITAQAASLRGHVSGGIDIGLNSYPRHLRASQLAATLRRDHPALELNFVDSDTNKIIDAIRTETLDAGFLFTELKLADFELVHLQKTPLAIAVPSSWKHELADGDWEAISRKPWIYTNCHCCFHAQIENAFEKRDLVFQSHIKADGDSMRFELVAAGMGIAIMERENAEKLVGEDKATIWESGEELFCNLNYGFLSRKKSDPAIQAAKKAILEIWEKSPE